MTIPDEPVLAALRAAVVDATEAAEGAAHAQLIQNPHAHLLVQRLREDGSFDLLPVGVQERLVASPIHQTHRLANNRIHTVTTVRLSGITPDRVSRALVEEPWTWWRHGRISGWTRTPEGGARFVLWPIWLRSPARVGIELAPPSVAPEEAWGVSQPRIVVGARFFADFEGPGAYEILGVRGGSVLRSVWDGVARRGVISPMPVWTVNKVHLGAEAGTLGFPFRSGTGFPGLIEHLGAAR